MRNAQIMYAAIVLGLFLFGVVWRRYSRRHKALQIPTAPPPPAAQLSPTPQHLPDLSSEDDELVAARFRQMAYEQKPPHSIQEPLRRAIMMLAREWGFEADINFHCYDLQDHDNHVVNIRLEGKTKKETRHT